MRVSIDLYTACFIPQCIEDFEETRKVYERVGVITAVATSLTNIAGLLSALGEVEAAIEKNKEVLKVCDEGVDE